MGVKFLLFLVAVTATAEGLPDGPGKELVEAVCTICHSTERIVTQQLTKPQWEAKVLEMLQEEPDVTQPERDKIVEYLAKNFPPKAKVKRATLK